MDISSLLAGLNSILLGQKSPNSDEADPAQTGDIINPLDLFIGGGNGNPLKAMTLGALDNLQAEIERADTSQLELAARHLESQIRMMTGRDVPPLPTDKDGLLAAVRDLRSIVERTNSPAEGAKEIAKIFIDRPNATPRAAENLRLKTEFELAKAEAFRMMTILDGVAKPKNANGETNREASLTSEFADFAYARIKALEAAKRCLDAGIEIYDYNGKKLDIETVDRKLNNLHNTLQWRATELARRNQPETPETSAQCGTPAEPIFGLIYGALPKGESGRKKIETMIDQGITLLEVSKGLVGDGVIKSTAQAIETEIANQTGIQLDLSRCTVDDLIGVLKTLKEDVIGTTCGPNDGIPKIFEFLTKYIPNIEEQRDRVIRGDTRQEPVATPTPEQAPAQAPTVETPTVTATPAAPVVTPRPTEIPAPQAPVVSAPVTETLPRGITQKDAQTMKFILEMASSSPDVIAANRRYLDEHSAELEAVHEKFANLPEDQIPQSIKDEYGAKLPAIQRRAKEGIARNLVGTGFMGITAATRRVANKKVDDMKPENCHGGLATILEGARYAKENEWK